MEAKQLKKLKRLLVIVVFFLLLIIFLNKLNLGNAIKNIFVGEEHESGEMKTNTTINVTEFDKDFTTFIKDYSKPTDVEMTAAYKKYNGKQLFFEKDGLIVESESYSGKEKMLVTNIWEAIEHKDKVKKPEFGFIDYMEATDTTLKIYLKNVTEDDFKEYIKQIDDEYSNELSKNKESVLFYASNTTSDRVKIEIDNKRNVAIIVYEF